MNCSRARSIVFVEQNPILACRSGSIGSSKTTPFGISKTQEVLVLSNEKGRHFVDQSNTNRIPDARNSALDRHLPTQMHFLNIDMRSRSTPGDPNAFLTLSNALSLDARRAKCISGVLKNALARRPSIQMRFRSVEMSSRSTPVDPNAFPIRANALSLDACRSKCSRTNVAN